MSSSRGSNTTRDQHNLPHTNTPAQDALWNSLNQQSSVSAVQPESIDLTNEDSPPPDSHLPVPPSHPRSTPSSRFKPPRTTEQHTHPAQSATQPQIPSILHPERNPSQVPSPSLHPSSHSSSTTRRHSGVQPSLVDSPRSKEFRSRNDNLQGSSSSSAPHHSNSNQGPAPRSSYPHVGSSSASLPAGPSLYVKANLIVHKSAPQSIPTGPKAWLNLSADSHHRDSTTTRSSIGRRSLPSQGSAFDAETVERRPPLASSSSDPRASSVALQRSNSTSSKRTSRLPDSVRRQSNSQPQHTWDDEFDNSYSSREQSNYQNQPSNSSQRPSYSPTESRSDPKLSQADLEYRNSRDNPQPELSRHLNHTLVQPYSSLQPDSQFHNPSSNSHLRPPYPPPGIAPPAKSWTPKDSLWNNDPPAPVPQQPPTYLTSFPSTAHPLEASTSTSKTSIPEQLVGSTLSSADIDESHSEVEVMGGFPIRPGYPAAATASTSNGSTSGQQYGGGRGNGGGNFGGGGGGAGKAKNKGNRTSYGVAGGGGKTRSDFNDDEEEEETVTESKSNSKGKGKAKGRPPRTSALFSTAMNKAVSVENRADKGKKGRVVEDRQEESSSASKNRRDRSRVIPQNAPNNQTEDAAQLISEAIERQAQMDGEPFRVGGGGRTGLTIKGVGSRKTPEILELDDDSDPNEEEDDIEDPDEFDARPNASTLNSHRPTTKSNVVVKTKKSDSHRRLSDNGAHPSSDDLGLRPIRQSGAAAGTHAIRNGHVSNAVGQYEQLGGTSRVRVKKAQSLGSRHRAEPSLDGAGRDGTDDYRQPQPSTSTTTSKATAKGKKATGLPSVFAVGIFPILVAEQAIEASHLESKLELAINTTGKGKITLRSTDFHELATIVAADLNWIECCETANFPFLQPHGPCFQFRFKNDRTKLLDQLRPEVLSEGEVTLDQNEIFVVCRGARTAVTGESNSVGQLIEALSKWKSTDGQSLWRKASQHKFNHYVPFYKQALQQAQDLRSASKPSSKKKPTGLDSSQPRLSFRTADFYGTGSGSKSDERNELRRDDAGDYVHQPRSTLDATVPSMAPRRSTRPSTSEYKERLPAPASDPYPAEQVVLEYPLNQPGSVAVTYGDKKRLNEEEFLNDTLIEFGLKKAIEDVKAADRARPDSEKIAPYVHVFNSFFYKKLSAAKRNVNAAEKALDPYQWVEKWTKKIKLFEKKYIIVPINEHLHWYLAIIVNPKWIVDNRGETPTEQSTDTPITRSRGSTAATDTGPIAVDSSSQSATPAPSADAPETTSRHFSKKIETKNVESTEEDDTEMVEADERNEAKIQADIQAQIAERTTGGERENEVDGDIIMCDPNVEGGGPPPTNGHRGAERDEMTLSDDDDEPATQTNIDSVTSTHDSSSRKISPSAEPVPPPTRTAVPIGQPVAPPKGASSPPPMVIEPRAQPETTINTDELAHELGLDTNSTDRCFILTFDSLGASHAPVIKKLRHYLNMEAMTKLNISHTASSLIEGIAVTVPGQPNFCDCGLYVLHYVEQFLADPEKMIKHIVSRHVPVPKNRLTAEAKKKVELLNKGMADETNKVWKAEVAEQKRSVMRSEVERLMEEYKPIQKEKQAKELEEKRKREERRKERDIREAALRSKENEDVDRERERRESEAAAAAPPSAKTTKGKPGRKKKETEVLMLSSDDDDDDESMQGSPIKSRTSLSTARSPAQQAPSPAQERQIAPTSLDFLPTDPLADRPRNSASSSHHVDTVDAVVDAPTALSETLEIQSPVDELEQDTSGDLNNTQDSDAETRLALLPPPSAQLEPRPRDLSDSENRSPPPKRQKRNIRQSPTPSDSQPRFQSQDAQSNPVEDQDVAIEEAVQEEEEQPDSSIEVRQPVTPELKAPPSGQVPRHTHFDDAEVAVSNSPKPSSSASKSSKKKLSIPVDGKLEKSKKQKRGSTRSDMTID